MLNKSEFEKEDSSTNFKNWLSDDYYHLLDIETTASLNEINRSFRIKIKDCNPALYSEFSSERLYTEQRLKKLIAAREILIDPVKREHYNSERQLLQDCYISYMSSSYNLFEKDKKIIKNPKFKDEPEKKLERLKKYVLNGSKAYHDISQNTSDEISDIFILCMSEHDFLH